jgi:hypothetical protein
LPTFGIAKVVRLDKNAHVAVWLVIGLTAVNVVSTLLECGFRACADNPAVYQLLKREP